MKIFCVVAFLILLTQTALAEQKSNNGFEYLDSIFSPPDTTIKKDSLELTDSVTVIDSLQQKVDVVSLVPINTEGLLQSGKYGTSLKHNDIYRNDYRYTADIFSYLPFGFIQNLGSLGQPSETMLYGTGFGDISFLSDGISTNNRMLNTFDLNFYQSESIDYLEIVPLPRGFLYGSFNNSVTVNFISKDTVHNKPYSRIRFYQSPFEEGMIDALFSLYVMSRLNISMEVANSSIENRYENSEYGSWKFSTRVRYMFSNKINIIGIYNYFKSQSSLNGGVDLDSIKATELENAVNEILYDNIQAPVQYGFTDDNISSRYSKNTRHNLNLKILGKFVKEFPTDLNLYYQFNQNAFRQNERGTEPGLATIVHNNKYNLLGLSLRQRVLFKGVSFDLVSNYERTDYKGGILKSDETLSQFSISGKAEINLFENVFKPAAFAKYLIHGDKSFFGFGVDVNLKLFTGLDVYTGSSYFEKPLSIIEKQYLNSSINIEKQKITTLEIGAKFNLKHVSGSASYFNYHNNDYLFPVFYKESQDIKDGEIIFNNIKKMSNQGFNINLNIHLWKILLSTNASYYKTKIDDVKNQLPEFNVVSGIYYVDTLFNNNLDIKTGINLKYFGKQNYRFYDFEKNRAAFYQTDPFSQSVYLIDDGTTLPTYQLDFFLAGKIQDLAIIYFVFENFLNEQYFIIPYYPMPFRQIRLGVSWEFLN